MGTSLNKTLAGWLGNSVSRATIAGFAPDCGACAKFGKCCDFQPFVPNVLLGAALAAGVTLPKSPERFALQPIGLVPTARFRRARDHRGARTADHVDQLCAFFVDGRCAIWDFRPGECSSYHCAGEDPAQAADSFALETSLAQMALIEQGFAPATVAGQIDILNEPGEDLDTAPAVETIYRRAWDWARHLSRADVAAYLEDL